ncbi:hypothetical protein WCLP8_5030012 [uncultured Gammaproteobacteria bacterium]
MDYLNEDDVFGGGSGSAAPTALRAPRAVTDIITEAANRHGLDPELMLAIAKHESDLNPLASNPKSSARGLYQFMTRPGGSWSEFGNGASVFDPEANADAGMRYTLRNAQYLRDKLGREPNPREIALAHQQGPGGALALLTNPDLPAVQVLSRFNDGDPHQKVVLNGGRTDMTASQFGAHVMDFYLPTSAALPNPAQPAPQPPVPSKYLSDDAVFGASGPTATPAPSYLSDDAVFGPTPGLWDRVKLNARQSFRDGTLAGELAKRVEIGSTPQDETAYKADEARRGIEMGALPPWQSWTEGAAALAGQIAGGVATPESLVPVGKGASVLGSLARGAATNGLISAAVDPILQYGQISRGERQNYSPADTAIHAGIGATVGGLANAATHAVSAIKAKFWGKTPEGHPIARAETEEELFTNFAESQKQVGGGGAELPPSSPAGMDAPTSATHAAPDAEGRFSTVGTFVQSDTGGPIRFDDQKQAAQWILKQGNTTGTDQIFDIANHPGGQGFTVYERGRAEPKAAPGPAQSGPEPTSPPPGPLGPETPPAPTPAVVKPVIDPAPIRALVEPTVPAGTPEREALIQGRVDAAVRALQGDPVLDAPAITLTPPPPQEVAATNAPAPPPTQEVTATNAPEPVDINPPAPTPRELQPVEPQPEAQPQMETSTDLPGPPVKPDPTLPPTESRPTLEPAPAEPSLPAPKTEPAGPTPVTKTEPTTYAPGDRIQITRPDGSVVEGVVTSASKGTDPQLTVKTDGGAVLKPRVSKANLEKIESPAAATIPPASATPAISAHEPSRNFSDQEITSLLVNPSTPVHTAGTAEEANELARRIVLTKGQNGLEHMALTDKSNRVIYDAVGGNDYAMLSPKGQTAALDPKSDIHIHHNHPREHTNLGEDGAPFHLPLSGADLGLLVHPGVDKISAYGRLGSFSMAHLPPSLRAFYRTDPAAKKARTAISTLSRTAADRSVDLLIDARKQGFLQGRRGDRAAQLLFLEALDAAGVIRHTHNIDLQLTLTDQTQYAHIKDKVAQHVSDVLAVMETRDVAFRRLLMEINHDRNYNPPGAFSRRRPLVENVPSRASGGGRSDYFPRTGNQPRAGDDPARTIGDLVNDVLSDKSGAVHPKAIADALVSAAKWTKAEAQEWSKAFSDGLGDLKQALLNTTALTKKSIVDNPLARFAKFLWYTKDGLFRSIARTTDSPAVETLRRKFYGAPGEFQGASTTFDEAVHQAVIPWENRVHRALEPFSAIKDKARRDAMLVQVGRQIANPSAIRTGTMVGDAAAAIAKVLAEIPSYMIKAGVEMGEVEAGYMTRVLDRAKLMAEPDKFKVAAERAFRHDGADTKTAKEAADTWLQRELMHEFGLSPHDGSDFVRINPGTGAPANTKSRVLSADAAKIMEPWYHMNPADTLPGYFRRMARKAEWTRRMGADLSTWKQLRKDMLNQGVGDRIPEVVDLVARSAGMDPPISATDRSASSFLRAAATYTYLSGTGILQMGEPAMAAVRTGNPVDTLRTYGKTVQVLLGKAATDARLAEDIGLVNRAFSDLISESVGLNQDAFERNKGVHQFSKVTLTEPLTRAQRVATMKVSQVYLRRLAMDVLDGGHKYAERELADLGISPVVQPSFAKFVKSLDGGDTWVEAFHPGEDNHAGQYVTALHRLVNGTILQASRSTRPLKAEGPLGSLLYGLTSYSFAFQKAVLNRVGSHALNALTERGLSVKDRLAMLAPLAMLAAVWTPIAAGVWGAREAFKTMATEPDTKHPKTTMDHIERIANSANLTGSLTVPWSIIQAVRFRRDPATAMQGPELGGISDLLKAGVGMVANNPESTNTNERNAANAAYKTIAYPALMAAMMTSKFIAPTPLGMVVQGAAAIGLAHPGTREAVVSAVAGPKAVHGSASRDTGRTSRPTGQAIGRASR